MIGASRASRAPPPKQCPPAAATSAQQLLPASGCLASARRKGCLARSTLRHGKCRGGQHTVILSFVLPSCLLPLLPPPPPLLQRPTHRVCSCNELDLPPVRMLGGSVHRPRKETRWGCRMRHITPASYRTSGEGKSGLESRVDCMGGKGLGNRANSLARDAGQLSPQPVRNRAPMH